MKNADRPVYPAVNAQGVISTSEHFLGDLNGSFYLTKREYFAAMAMQSLINYYGVNDDRFKNDKIQPLAEKSILIADELLKQLDQ